MHTFLQKKIIFCDISARSLLLPCLLIFSLIPPPPHTQRLPVLAEKKIKIQNKAELTKNEASMGAEFFVNSALFCIFIFFFCARTGNLYVCDTTSDQTQNRYPISHQINYLNAMATRPISPIWPERVRMRTACYLRSGFTGEKCNTHALLKKSRDGFPAILLAVWQKCRRDGRSNGRRFKQRMPRAFLTSVRDRRLFSSRF